MDIFDELIVKTNALLPDQGMPFAPVTDVSKHRGQRSELILGRETAFELGGSNCPCVNGNFFTQDESLVPEDEIVVLGKDLHQLKKDSPFARFAFIRTGDIEQQGEQGAYAILENIGIRKYDVFPKGYMVRTSALSNREQIRVSKTALKNRLSFADVGTMYIEEYKKNKYVEAVKMVFVTLPDVDYIQLDRMATLSNQLFRALNKMVADLKMDCKACEWKIVCDEVEGMKQLHEKMLNNQH